MTRSPTRRRTDALKVVLSGAEVAVESTSPVAALAAV